MRLGIPILVLLLALGPASGDLGAAFVPVGGLHVEAFDESAKAWRTVPVEVDYQAHPEALRVRARGPKPGERLRLRLELQRVPYYRQWVDERRREGGAAWSALDAVLEQLDGGILAAQTLLPLTDGGGPEVALGLLKGHRFQPEARARGTLRFDAGIVSFEPQSLVFDDTRAALAWDLLAPMARRQAARAAGQTGP